MPSRLSRANEMCIGFDRVGRGRRYRNVVNRRRKPTIGSTELHRQVAKECRQLCTGQSGRAHLWANPRSTTTALMQRPLFALPARHRTTRCSRALQLRGCPRWPGRRQAGTNRFRQERPQWLLPSISARIPVRFACHATNAEHDDCAQDPEDDDDDEQFNQREAIRTPHRWIGSQVHQKVFHW
jgi:hypothetical protein